MRLKPFFLNASENVQNNWLQHLVSKGKEKSYLKQKIVDMIGFLIDIVGTTHIHTNTHTK